VGGLQLAAYEDRAEPIDPAAEIELARRLVWGGLDPSTGEPQGARSGKSPTV
jgi:hypothetical protein